MTDRMLSRRLALASKGVAAGQATRRRRLLHMIRTAERRGWHHGYMVGAYAALNSSAP
jgi:hypothetical protein